MNKNHPERGEAAFILTAIVIVLIIIGSIGFTVAWNSSRQTVTCAVNDKQATSKKDGGNNYILFTDNCGQLQVADDWINGQFNSSDTYAKIKPGSSYTFQTVGWRNGFFSAYPNVLTATQ